MEIIELKTKVGSVLEYKFIENKFYRANIDNTYRKFALQISGFELLSKNRIGDQHGNDMDYEVFISSLKIINCNSDIVGPNNERIDEAWYFRLIPTSRKHTEYIHSGGTLLLEVDSIMLSKESTIDGYTGAPELNINDDSFMVSYEIHKQKPKTKEELEDSIVCPVCKSNDIRDTSTKENNGGYVGSYKEWKVTDTRACNKCGVMFIPVIGNGLEKEKDE